jgi:hypothetical protein
VRLIKLLMLAAGAAYAYKRFFVDARAGVAETAAAEPYSSEQLADEPGGEPEQEPASEPAPAEAEAGEQEKDTLERPTWLDPADAS